MKYTFEGFLVSKMMELKVDIKDMIILRYFVDFKDSGVMKMEVIDNKPYYWVNYNSVVESNPHLELEKRAVMKRMFKLRDLGILLHHTKKNGGTFSFFAIGPRYIELIDYEINNNPEKKKSIESKSVTVHEESEELKGVLGKAQGMPECAEGCAQESTEGVPHEEHPYASKSTTKINLIKDSSTKETLNIKNIKKEVDEIVEHLNLMTSAKYKSNSKNTIKLINARINDGYSVDDFKLVINKKSKEWLGTKFEQYLTPQTLFGSKFENYLNQKIVVEKQGSSKEKPKLRFNNFEPREYDYDDLEKKLLGWDEGEEHERYI